jgi:hypothetical protein
MNFIGQLVAPIVLGLIIWLILIVRRPGSALPRFRMPAPPRPRPKRSHLRMVKTSNMDAELAKLLRSEDKPPRSS